MLLSWDTQKKLLNRLEGMGPIKDCSESESLVSLELIGRCILCAKILSWTTNKEKRSSR